jgi:tetratricopeptide (TPR) repeat protein
VRRARHEHAHEEDGEGTLQRWMDPLLVVFGSLLSVALAIAVNVATGGQLPLLDDRYRTWAWPAVAVLSGLTALTAISHARDRASSNVESQSTAAAPAPAGAAATAAVPAAVAIPGPAAVERALPAAEPGRRAIVNLPARNPHFTDREQLLDALHDCLVSPTLTATLPRNPSIGAPVRLGVQALYGLSGVGKSQLALEYAHRFLDDYDLVWWVPAQQAVAIPSALAELGRRLDLPERPDQQAFLAELLSELNERDRWLLVFDNAERPRDLEPYRPSNHRGHVLITSRNPAWRGVATPIKVDPLPEEEAIWFLLRRTASDDRPAAAALAEELGYLPLALEQAASFMEQTGLLMGEYLAQYRRRRDEMVDQGEPVAYGATVDTSIRIAIERVRTVSPVAEELLRLSAFLAPEWIPHPLLNDHGTGLLPSELADAVGDEGAYTTTVGLLYGYSLVERDSNGTRLHRIVQAVVRRNLTGEQRAAWAGRAVDLLAAAWPERSEYPSTWTWCGHLLPHVLSATEHVEQVHADTRTATVLLNKVSVNLRAQADFPAAQLVLERAQRLLGSLATPNDALMASTVANLGRVLRRRGDSSGARRRLEEALQMFESLHGPEHDEVALTLNYLGLTLHDLGLYEEARDRYLRALEIFERLHGPEHDEVALTLNYLGGTLCELGEAAEGRDRLERSLAIFQANHGADHPEVARARDSAGVALHCCGDLDRARTYLEEALAAKEATYGPEHPETAATLRNLGSLLRDLDEPAEARGVLERALAIFERSYDPEHPEVGRTLHELGLAVKGLGDDEGGRPLMRRALELLERALGADHPRTRKVRQALEAP